jgi:hypothetical protein
MDVLPISVLLVVTELVAPPAPLRVQLADLPKEVRAVAVNADGSAVAAASADRVLRAWDLPTGKERLAREFPTPITDVAFSPDGHCLATLSKVLELWDPRGGEPIAAAPGLTGARLDFAPDGAALAIGWHRVRLLDLKSLQADLEMPEQAGWVNVSLAYSSDGKLLAAGDGAGTVWVWDVPGRSLRFRRKNHTGKVTGVGFIDDGRTLVSGGGDGLMKFYDLSSGREIGALTPHEPRSGGNRAVAALTCSFDGKVIATAGADDGTVRLWEAASGKLRATLPWTGVAVTGLAISVDGSTLAAGGRKGAAGTAAAWRLYATGPRLVGSVSKGLWQQLSGDPATAYRAVLALASHPAVAVAILGQRLRPILLNEAAQKECDGLIASLGDDSFDVRDEASRKLEAMSPWVQDYLKKAQAEAKTLELQRRLQALLAKVGQSTLPLLRAIEALEHAPGSEARALLRSMAAGEPSAPITHEARRALQRLERLESLYRP